MKQARMDERRVPSRLEQYDSLARLLESMINRLATGQVADVREAELLIRATESYITLLDLEAEVKRRRDKLRNS